jgi:nucleoside-diphosphate-sugar epimerase
MTGFWRGRPVVVTGGASFIGSHLVDALVKAGARVRVADDLSSGSRANLRQHLECGAVDLIHGDLRDWAIARRAVAGMDIVFHLAADHGGRGYVDTHQAGPASNLALDGIVFLEGLQAGVQKIVYASSGCVYPNFLQTDPDSELYLTEDLVKPPYDADNFYGWAKLMGELTLQAYWRERRLRAVSCRYFTVYGPRAKVDHAIMAMVARAYLRQDPFEVWGTGEQVRNWTYVDDIVEGTMRAAESIEDAQAINLGSMERIRVIDAARLAMEYLGYRPEIVTRPDMPTGPLNRVADNSLARRLLGWDVRTSFQSGLRRTIDWFRTTYTPDQVHDMLQRGLIERQGSHTGDDCQNESART